MMVYLIMNLKGVNLEILNMCIVQTYHPSLCYTHYTGAGYNLGK